jgi:hypothetical protein
MKEESPYDREKRAEILCVSGRVSRPNVTRPGFISSPYPNLSLPP